MPPAAHPAFDAKLVILEGIMGTGKSTTSRWLAGQLRGNGVKVAVSGDDKLWGRSPPHVVRTMLAGLSHPGAVWSKLTPDDLVERSRQEWRHFLTAATAHAGVSLIDGRFFHADLAALMMMETPEAAIREHAIWIGQALSPLRPRLIYLHPGDIGTGMDRVLRARGKGWEAAFALEGSVAAPWSHARLESPYYRTRGLQGIEGTVSFYRDYVELCGRLLPVLGLPFLRLDTSGGDWPAYRSAILGFLDLHPVRDLRFATWWLTKRPRLWASRALGTWALRRPPTGRPEPSTPAT